MSGRARLIALAGAGLLLLTPAVRARVTRALGALGSPREGLRDTGQPTEAYAPAMVDRRHLTEVTAPAQPAHGTTATEVAVEFYEEHPPA